MEYILIDFGPLPFGFTSELFFIFKSFAYAKDNLGMNIRSKKELLRKRRLRLHIKFSKFKNKSPHIKFAWGFCTYFREYCQCESNGRLAEKTPK